MTAHRDPGHADVVGLVLGDHARLRSLFTELQAAKADLVRLAALWAELSAVLLAHCGAVEEVISVPLLGAAPDRLLALRDLRDQMTETRDALAEARLRTTGSPQWWLAVGALHAVVDRHISSMEAGPLPRFRQRTPRRARQELGRQWNRFMADASDDNLEAGTS